MKALIVSARVLLAGCVLLSSVCWPMGDIISGMPEFFPGDPVGGFSGGPSPQFDVFGVMIEQDQVWPGEGIPGMNGILQPDEDQDDQAIWGRKAGQIDNGEDFLANSGPTLWDKAKEAVNSILAYFKPVEIPDNKPDLKPDEPVNPAEETLIKADNNAVDSGNPWREDSESEAERSAYYQREAQRFQKRQREKEQLSLFSDEEESIAVEEESATVSESSSMIATRASGPDTTKVYNNSLPGVVFLPENGRGETGNDGNRGEAQAEGQEAPSAPPPAGDVNSEQGPPTYQQVMSGQVPAGRPTRVFQNGRIESATTLPLLTTRRQVEALYPGVPQDIPHSTQRLESFGEKKQAMQDAAKELDIPVGLVHRFSALREYQLEIIIDDSYSMGAEDTQLSLEMDGRSQLSRMDELKYRLHTMASLLSLVAESGIILRTLSNLWQPTRIAGGRPAHIIESELRSFINGLTPSLDHTPLNQALQRSFDEARSSGRQRMVYIFTDGQPTDSYQMWSRSEGFRRCMEDIRNARDEAGYKLGSAFFPVTMMACTDRDDCIEWMNRLDVDFENVQVMDDYFSERQEVYDHHGGFFPYTPGMYLAAGLLGAIDDDLDKLDESKIYSKRQLEDLLGYRLTNTQYRDYQSQASIARNRKICRDLWGIKRHPLDRVNQQPLNMGGIPMYRLVNGYRPMEIDQDDDYEPDPCPCPNLSSCTIL